MLGACEVIGARVAREASPVCPAAKPESGQDCEADGLTCSYGESLMAYCRDYVTCSHRVWSHRTDCQVQPEGFCPAVPTPGLACVVGKVSAFVPCEYPPSVVCYCLGNPGARGNWECYGPPRNGACPEVLPNLGDGCARPGQFCNYGVVGQGCSAPYANVSCSDGAWQREGTPCVD